mgnify:FL=1
MDINLTELIVVLVIGSAVGAVIVFTFFNRKSPDFTEALEDF